MSTNGTTNHNVAGITALLLGMVVNVSQFSLEPAKIYRTGENWLEMSRAHHRVSENASATEPAELLDLFVADAGEKLISPEPH